MVHTQIVAQNTGFSLRILGAGERCNLAGEYFERGSMSEQKNGLRLWNVSQRIIRSSVPNEHPENKDFGAILLPV